MKQCPKYLYFLAAGLLAGVAGCGQKLNVDRTIALDVGGIKSISVDPPRGDQKVTVDFSSAESPVDVYLVLADDQAAVEKSLTKGTAVDAAKVKDSKLKAKEGMLQTTVPGGKGFSVFFTGARKNTEVKVKVKGT